MDHPIFGVISFHCMPANHLHLLLCKSRRKISTLFTAQCSVSTHSHCTLSQRCSSALLASGPVFCRIYFQQPSVSSCRSYVHRGGVDEWGCDETRKASGNIVTTQHNQTDFWPQWDLNVLSFQTTKQHGRTGFDIKPTQL